MLMLRSVIAYAQVSNHVNPGQTYKQVNCQAIIGFKEYCQFERF
ncbi:MAG: hypothetical protein ABRQ39_28925 [Candidatus Eremiobacterota bacterium]